MTPEELLGEFRSQFKVLTETLMSDLGRLKDDVGKLYDRYNTVNNAVQELTHKLALVENSNSGTAALLKKDLEHFRDMVETTMETLVQEKCHDLDRRVPSAVQEALDRLERRISEIRIPNDRSDETRREVLREVETRVSTQLHDHDKGYDEFRRDNTKNIDELKKENETLKKDFADYKVSMAEKFTELKTKMGMIAAVAGLAGSGIAGVLFKLLFK